MTRRVLMGLMAAMGFFGLSTTAMAQEASLPGIDVELDPIAYALKGHSLHVGVWWERWRLDLGSFAITVPVAFHKQEGFTQSFDGFGLKLDRSLTQEQRGWFVGAMTSLIRANVRWDETRESEPLLILDVGVRAGYRWNLGEGFFLSPWLGVGHMFGGEDVVLSGQRFSTSAVSFFPTVHLGYQVR